jgi:hypothetical protein
MWRFDPIPSHELPLVGFAITLTGHTTLGKTPLVEWSTRHGNLYLARHNFHKRQISTLPAGLETPTPTSERLSNHWDRLSLLMCYFCIYWWMSTLISINAHNISNFCLSKYFVLADLEKDVPYTNRKNIHDLPTYQIYTSVFEQWILNTGNLPLSYLFGLNVGIWELIGPVFGVRFLSSNLVESYENT